MQEILVGFAEAANEVVTTVWNHWSPISQEYQLFMTLVTMLVFAALLSIGICAFYKILDFLLDLIKAVIIALATWMGLKKVAEYLDANRQAKKDLEEIKSLLKSQQVDKNQKAT
jgi:hypothetical protein